MSVSNQNLPSLRHLHTPSMPAAVETRQGQCTVYPVCRDSQKRDASSPIQAPVHRPTRVAPGIDSKQNARGHRDKSKSQVRSTDRIKFK